MFYRARRESDLEGNHGGHATHDLLDFHDPSWIIDHHRPNLITKISKPGGSWFNVLFGQKHGTNNASDNNQKGPGKGHTGKAVAEQSQLRLSSQLPQGVTGTIHKQLEETEKSYRINFAELQRLRLRQLQHKLMQHAIDLRYDAMEPPEWAEDLRQYGKSILV